MRKIVFILSIVMVCSICSIWGEDETFHIGTYKTLVTITNNQGQTGEYTVSKKKKDSEIYETILKQRTNTLKAKLPYGAYQIEFLSNKHIGQKKIIIITKRDIETYKDIEIQISLVNVSNFNQKLAFKKAGWKASSVFYVLGGIFPATNLLGFPYYTISQARDITSFASFLTVPFFIAPSFILAGTSIALMAAGGYKFFIDQSPDFNIGMFAGSIATAATSYLISLFFTVVVSAFRRSEYDEKRIENDLKKKLLESLSIGYDFREESLQLALTVPIKGIGQR